MKIVVAGLCVAAVAAAPSPLLAQAHPEERDRVSITGRVFEPTPRAPQPSDDAALRLPDGFRVERFADNLGNIRILAVAPNGDVYASRRAEGDVILLRDADGDGRADAEPRVVARRAGTHGITIHDGRLYLATVKEVFVGDIEPDGSVSQLQMIIGDLPDGGQHPNRTIAVGPDGMLYISVGSTCNACAESNPENATILRASLDGKSRTIFASGLRNTIGFGWHPASGELWGFDHGIDWLGDDVQAEELNRIERGKRYGWPYVHGLDEAANPQDEPPGRITTAEWAAESEAPVLGYTAHAAPMQMAFHPGGSFPSAYAGDAFVTMRGSWNREPASGYEVVRVDFDGRRPRAIEPFLSGFLVDDGRSQTARLTGVAVMRDGSLLVGDDQNGVLYRVSYGSRSGGAAELEPPAGPMRRQAAEGSGVPLAIERIEAAGVLTVSSNFGDDQPIPPNYSEYYEGVSPPLSWSPVEGAVSYVVIVEDPDATAPRPFVHWVAWNIRDAMLPEGLQEEIVLPNGIVQGRTSRGSPGWMGPRPPVGDPPHRYHFQIFALDRMLDVPPGSDRDRVLEAMRGHVLAEGTLVGAYRQTDAPLK